MIGMNFASFLTLLVISLVVSVVLHYLVKYRVVPGVEGLFGKLIIGWLGGWVGSPVFGYWWTTAKVENVYIVPALLGSLATVFGVAFLLRVGTMPRSEHKPTPRPTAV
jgi:uncharacterized membrane protein YeaQ/YmgE (transglycosylase-associated protein family)